MSKVRRFLLRKSVLIPLGIAVIVAACWLALRILLSEENIKRTIEELARRELGCEAEVGAARLGLFSGLQVERLGLRFGDGPPWLTVGKLHVGLDTPTLLTAKFRPVEVTIERPAVSLTRQVVKALRSIKVEAGGEAAFPEVIRLVGGRLSIAQGALAGEQPPLSLEVNHLAVSSLASGSGHVEFRCDCRLVGAGHLVVRGTVSQAQKEAEIHLGSEDFRPGGLPLGDILEALGSPAAVEALDGTVAFEANCRVAWAGESPAVDYAARVDLAGLSFTAKRLPGRIAGLSGKVVFREGKLLVENATGWLDRSPFEVGRLDVAFDEKGKPSRWAVLARLQALPISLLTSEAVPETLKKALADVGLRDKSGTLDLRLALEGDPKGVAGTIEAEAHGLVVAPPGFDYPLPPVSATLRYDVGQRRLSVSDVRAAGPTVAIEASGQVALDHPRPGFSFAANVRGLQLDATLKRALPPRAQETWDELGVGGGRLDAELQVAGGGDGQMRPEALVRAFSLRLKPKVFPYQLPPLSGRIRYSHPGRIEVLDLRGESGKVVVGASGEVVLEGKTPRVNLRFSASGIAMDKALVAALPTAVREAIGRVGLATGLADATVALASGPDGTVADVEATLRDGVAVPRDFPIRLENVNARVRYLGERGVVVLDHLAATHDGASLRLDGRFRTGKKAGLESLTLAARDLKADRSLLGALPQEVRQTIEPFEPEGKLDLDLSLRDEEDGARRLEVAAALKGMAATLGAGPEKIRLTSLVGDLRTDGAVLTLRGLRGKVGETTFEADGSLALSGDAAAPGLRIRIPPMAVGQKTLATLPARLSSALEGLGLSGTVEGSIAIGGQARTGGPVLESASVRLINFALGTASLERLFGTVTLLAKPGEPIAVAATMPQAHVKGLDLRGLVASGILTPDQLLLENLSWNLCGGTVAGCLNVAFGRKVKYSGLLALEHLDAQSLFSALGQKEGAPSGWLRGGVEFRGDATGFAGLEASGTCSLSRGALYELPLIATVWNVLSLRLPGRGTLTDARVEFDLRDRVLHLRHFLLSGTTTPMDITGTIKVAPGAGAEGQELDLVFTIAKARDLLDRLPVVGWLKERSYNRLRRYFLQARVTGTLARPKVEVLPKPLLAPIKAFWSVLKEAGGKP